MLLCLTMTAGSAAFAQYGMKVWRFGSAEQYILTYVDSVSFVKLVTDIQLTPTINMEVGNMKWLTAKVLPEDADNKEVIFFCSDPEVATVSEDNPAIVIGRHSGTCTVTCRALDGSGVTATCEVTVEGGQGMIDGYDFVDLGLPSGTLWAKYNVGTYSPSDPGDFFAWGETSWKTDYSWETYKHCEGSATTITRYCPNSRFGYNGFTDSLTELLPEDDAATKQWGSSWQMPSKEQFEELLDSNYTTTEWTTMNDVNGLKVTGKTGGQSIFLPVSGYYDGTSLQYANDGGFYWSRSLGTSNSSIYGFNLLFYSPGSFEMQENYRCSGRSVRPVSIQKADPILVSGIELSQTSLTLMKGKSAQLTANVLPANARNKAVAWGGNNPRVAVVSETGEVTAKRAGTCTITCSATDGSGVKATCEVTVKVPESVDLGLPSGTLWATCNVGADYPDETGDYFAWGETEPKTDYSWSTYKYLDGSNYTKYNRNDGLTVLLAEDDAATANWGSEWQTPSYRQFEELFDSTYTTVEWKKEWRETLSYSGVRITSKANGNSIFLPIAGLYDYPYGYLNGPEGYYWSRILYPQSIEKARIWQFGLDNGNNFKFGINYYPNRRPDCNRRINGLSVRPVMRQAVRVEQIVLGSTSLSLLIGDTRTLTATVLPEDADNQAVSWTSSDADVACVELRSNGATLVAVSPGTCTITCSASDGSGVKATCEVTVLTPESVDLGLPSGTLWATCNVGAGSPEEYGNYYAWGETEPKDSYTWKTYEYCMGAENTLTKYCGESEYGYNGFTDDLTELLPEDDAATVNWGRDWQTPSIEQFYELINNNYTTTEWTVRNGVYGRLITSKSNSNSIFLPAAGTHHDNDVEDAGEYGNYWMRMDWGSMDLFGPYLIFNSRYINCEAAAHRSLGLTVRPVRKK